jgi:GAF domain-containing protein
MFAATNLSSLTVAELYRALEQQTRALTDGETDPVANMANCVALIFNSVPRLNWAGFYLVKGNELVLGPFQGQPACVRIPIGKGVCGTAAKTGTTIRVQDVTKFEGHIACDSNSKSELVIPILASDRNVVAVLDLDSPEFDRFSAEDEIGLTAVAAIIACKI